MISNKYYLYQHIRLDKDVPFYIGIGTRTKKDLLHNKYDRAHHKVNRSKYWNNIVSKTDYRVEILLESNDYEFIKKKEIEFISLYGRRDLGKGTLVNLTDGGEGRLNYKESFESKSKRIKSLTGKIRSEESITNIRNSKLGKKLSTNHKLKISLGSKHRKLSEEEKKKLSKRMKGENNPNYGKPINSNLKRSISRKIINTDNGIIYESIKDAAIKNNIYYSTLKKMITGKIKNKTSLIYYNHENSNNNSLYPTSKSLCN